ncbi:MAG: PEP-CTERM sorting domain-containing protein [Proteobacteria bacterium]|nr:PEP-CTERM sorting domain-containing protein [Pseudomonadota bacterium]
MNIFDTGEGAPHGTFDSQLNFSFDITGSVGGFYATIEKVFNSSDNNWQHAPPPLAIPLINGVDSLFNGGDITNDFWATVPEPGSALLIALGLAGLVLRCRRND